MKFVLRHQLRHMLMGGREFYVTALFRQLIDLLKNQYPEHEFELDSSHEYDNFGYGSVSSCMSFSIINPENDNYILLSLFDNWRYHFMTHLGWKPKQMKQFFYAGGFNFADYFDYKYVNKHNSGNEFPENIQEVYQPFYYNPYFDCCYDEMNEISKGTYNQKSLFFRGWMWDSRKLMINNINRDDIIIIDKNVDGQNLNYLEYLQEMKNYKVALSLPGGTEICNRDIECFGIGVPVIRPPLQINFEDPLIPNYHYISFYEPCDYSPMGHPNYRSYDDFQKSLLSIWDRVKDNDEYLNFISRNAKVWFERNCKLQSNLKFLSKKINLNLIK